MSPIKMYWSSGLKNGKKNFGDWLGPELVKVISRRPVEHVSPARADLMSVGSILQKLDGRWWKKRVHVWGCGFIEAPSHLLGRHFFHAVRGPLTASRLVSGGRPPVMGDPGLLSPLLLPDYQDIRRQFRVGVVPHYRDQDDPELLAAVSRLSNFTVIDVLDEPENVLRQIAACQCIVSSSLHGLVVADAFGLPSLWMKCGNRVRGDDFKFHDYYGAFGIEAAQAVWPAELTDQRVEALLNSAPLSGVQVLQKNLLESFPFSP